MERKDSSPTREFPVIDIEQYGGKEVAIAEGKVIAAGRTLAEVIKKVKQLRPQRPLTEVDFLTVPKGLNVIYHA